MSDHIAAAGPFPAIRPHVVVVRGPSAAGIYDLNEGEFHRVTHAAATLIESCTGVTPLHDWAPPQQALIEEAKAKGLVDYRGTATGVRPTRLDEILRPLRPPTFAWVEVTSKCNQKCLHCFLGDDLNATPHVPVERLRRYADELESLGVKQVIISGGEPTLHPQFREILSYYAQRSFRLTLLTNAATKRFESLIDDLRKWEITVKVSILGWEQTHDEMAGLPGGFERTMAALRALVAAGVRTQLGTTVTAVNEHDVARIKAFAEASHLPLEFSPIFLVGWARKNEARLMPRSMRRVIEICQDENRPTRAHSRPKTPSDTTDDYAAVDLHGYLSAHHECGQKIVALLANGTVSPCLLLREPEHLIGDLDRNRLTAIVDGSADRRSFDATMSLDAIPGCRNCEARFVCKAGGCPASAYALTGFVARKNPLYDKCYYATARQIEEPARGAAE